MVIPGGIGCKEDGIVLTELDMGDDKLLLDGLAETVKQFISSLASCSTGSAQFLFSDILFPFKNKCNVY